MSVDPEFVLISDTDSEFRLTVESALTLDGLKVMRPAIFDHKIIITAENGTEMEAMIRGVSGGGNFFSL